MENKLVEEISDIWMHQPRLDDIGSVLGFAIYELHMGSAIQYMFSNDEGINRFLVKLGTRIELTGEMSTRITNCLRDMASGK